MHKPFEILGTGTSLPERVMTNADLEKIVETSDEWIVDRTGIKERRIAGDGVATSDLCAGALREACEDAQMSPDDLDAIIVATSTPDCLFPSTACWTQSHLKLKGVPAFDVSAGCTGWLYALELAANLIVGKTSRRVAVVAGEVMSKVLNWEDRRTCVLFGDGAGAMIIGETDDPSRGMLASNWGADGTLADILYQPAGGTRQPATAETVAKNLHTVHMEGSAVFRQAVRSMTQSCKRAIADAGVSADGIDLFIAHQANLRIIEATRSRVGVPEERAYNTVGRYGNMSAATIPVALHEARKEGRVEPGTLLAMTSFGTGLTWGSSILRV